MSQAFREVELLILPIDLAYCEFAEDGLRIIPSNFIMSRQLPPIDVQIMSLVKEDRLKK